MTKGGRPSEVPSCPGALQILCSAKGQDAALSYRHGQCFSLAICSKLVDVGQPFLSTSAVCHKRESARDSERRER